MAMKGLDIPFRLFNEELDGSFEPDLGEHLRVAARISFRVLVLYIMRANTLRAVYPCVCLLDVEQCS